MMMSLVGRTLGEYQLEQVLGTGTVGVVYRATHVRRKTAAAVKVIHDRLVADPGFPERFRRVTEAMRALEHKHIVRIEMVGEDRGQYYIAMELLERATLRTLLERRSERRPEALPLEHGVGFVRQAAEALIVAHAAGVLHRGLKPEDFLLADAETLSGGPRDTSSIKLMDWGLTQLIDTGATIVGNLTPGSPMYMSPEQCRGVTPDARSDIYSLGIILYEVSAGYPPFQVVTLGDAVRKHLEVAPPLPRGINAEIPETLERIILRCLAKSPVNRFQTAAELSVALGEVLATMRAVGDKRRIAWRNHAPPADVAANAPASEPPAGRIRVRLRDGNADAQRAASAANASPAVAPPREPIAPPLAPPAAPPIVQPPPPPPPPPPPRAEEPPRRRIRLGPDDGASAGPTIPGAEAVRRPRDPDAPRARPEESKRIRVTIDRPHITLVPGQPVVVRCTIMNGGRTVDHFPLTVEGVPANWAQLPPAPPQLNPGERASIGITVLVPRAADSHAGTYAVTIRATGLKNPNDAGTAPAEWTVLPFAASAMTIAPSRVRGWRTASFGIDMKNDGNTPAEYQLTASDDEQLLRYRFGDAHVSLGPGDKASTRVFVSAPTRWIGSLDTRAFTVHAVPTPGAITVPQAPTMSSGQFVRRAIIPLWVPPVLLLAAAALFFLLKDRNTLRIEVVPPRLQLAVGATAKLAAQVSNAKGEARPDTGLAWSSRDSLIASVGNDGSVHGRTVGATAITVARGKWSKTAEVEVVAAKVEALTLVPRALSMKAGNTAKLLAVAKDGAGNPLKRDATWMSSDPTVATVGGDGRVVAKDSGRATITAMVDGKVATSDIAVSGGAKGAPGSGGNADCVAYEPGALKVVQDKAAGWIVTDGANTLLTLDGEADAKRALNLARDYKSHCFLGRRNARPNRSSFIIEYWEKPSGASSVIDNEDCVAYDRSSLKVQEAGRLGFALQDAHSRVLLADTKDDAQKAWEVAQAHSRQCFIGRGNRRSNQRDYIVQYWK